LRSKLDEIGAIWSYEVVFGLQAVLWDIED
jgi:hypothetical protein